MTARPATVLPVATIARALPTTLTVLVAPGAGTAHIGLDVGAGRVRPACGRRRPRRAAVLDLGVQEPPALRVCKACARTLPDLTRVHLATAGRPTPAELVAVHDARIRAVAAGCVAELERIREDAVFDGSVSELVHLVEAVPNERRPDHQVETLTFGGHTAAAVPMTLGLLAGALMPGARTHSRVWITDPPPVGAAVGLPQGDIGSVVALAPSAPGRFSTYTRPQVQQRIGGARP